MKKRSLLIISLVCFMVAGIASLGFTQDYELSTGDNEISDVDQAEFIDLRTVRLTIQDVKALIAIAKVQRANLSELIANDTAAVAGAKAAKAVNVAAKPAVVDQIASLQAIRDVLREMAADLKLNPTE